MRLAVLDHVASFPPLVMPVVQMAAVLKQVRRHIWLQRLRTCAGSEVLCSCVGKPGMIMLV